MSERGNYSIQDKIYFVTDRTIYGTQLIQAELCNYVTLYKAIRNLSKEPYKET